MEAATAWESVSDIGASFSMFAAGVVVVGCAEASLPSSWPILLLCSTRAALVLELIAPRSKLPYSALSADPISNRRGKHAIGIGKNHCPCIYTGDRARLNKTAPSQGVTMPAAPELKATLTLPQTAFPMKANLPQNEPLRLARWTSLRLYDKLRHAGLARPAYLLHDGPPYANGPIHLGHALNKGLKDFVVKSKTMAGFDAPYVPGYDCHGLPIEIKVDEQLGRKKLEMPAPQVLDACRNYAQKYIDLQTSQFERIGVLGRRDAPYKTMSRDYEARTLEAFYGFLEKGFVYRGLKPVYWCIHDRTALAEAEVEYEMHTSPSVYVRYKLTSDPEAIHPALAGRQVYTIIWTTTPWTLPASLAVAFHPDFDYVALEAGDRPDAPVYIVAAELAAQVAAACQLDAPAELARFKGAALDRVMFQHPFLDRSEERRVGKE